MQSLACFPNPTNTHTHTHTYQTQVLRACSQATGQRISFLWMKEDKVHQPDATSESQETKKLFTDIQIDSAGLVNMSLIFNLDNGVQTTLKNFNQQNYTEKQVAGAARETVTAASTNILLGLLYAKHTPITRKFITMSDEASLEWMGRSCGIQGMGAKYAGAHTMTSHDANEFMASCVFEQRLLQQSMLDGGSLFYPQNSGISSLHRAVLTGSARMVEAVLIAADAERPFDGSTLFSTSAITPLHYAVVEGYPDIIKLLVEFGLDPYQLSSAHPLDLSPVQIACLHRWPEVEFTDAFGDPPSEACSGGHVEPLIHDGEDTATGTDAPPDITGGYLTGAVPDDHIPDTHSCNIDVRAGLTTKQFEVCVVYIRSISGLCYKATSVVYVCRGSPYSCILATCRPHASTLARIPLIIHTLQKQ